MVQKMESGKNEAGNEISKGNASKLPVTKAM